MNEQKTSLFDLLDTFLDMKSIGEELSSSLVDWVSTEGDMALEYDEDALSGLLSADKSGEDISIALENIGIGQGKYIAWVKKNKTAIVRKSREDGGDGESTDVVPSKVASEYERKNDSPTLSEQDNTFVSECLSLGGKYPSLFDNVILGENDVEVRLTAKGDPRRLPRNSEGSKVFFSLLKGLREIARDFNLHDDAHYFLKASGIYIISFRPQGKTKLWIR